VARAAVAATLQQDALAKLDAAMDAMFDAWATLRAADKIAAESGRPAADTPNGPTMRIPLPPAIAKRVAEKRQHHPGWFSTEEIQHRVPAAHAALTSQLALDALLKETTDVEA
jgi:hypothetical protein